jgi:hypothetical protein
MSGLVRNIAEIDDAVTALECTGCHHRHPWPDEIDTIDVLSEGELRSKRCGCGAFIPRHGTSIAEKFPGQLGDRFVPIPHALFDLGVTALGLSSHQLLVVMTLERFRRQRGQIVSRDHKILARDTGPSESSIRRALHDLEKRGLVIKSRGTAGKGHYGHNSYDLTPLWEKLSELDAKRAAANGHSDTRTALTTNGNRSSQ